MSQDQIGNSKNVSIESFLELGEQFGRFLSILLIINLNGWSNICASSVANDPNPKGIEAHSLFDWLISLRIPLASFYSRTFLKFDYLSWKKKKIKKHVKIQPPYASHFPVWWQPPKYGDGFCSTDVPLLPSLPVKSAIFLGNHLTNCRCVEGAGGTALRAKSEGWNGANTTFYI